MAVYNQNYDFINLTSTGSPYVFSALPTVHKIYCVSGGTITIGASGSGTQATIPMTAGQSIDIMICYANVISGSFLGIKAQGEYYYSSNG